MSKLEWNLGGSRIEFIGSLVNKVRVSHYRVENQNTVKSLKTYRNLLKELYFELDMYVDSWEEHKPGSLNDDPSKILNNARQDLEGRITSTELNAETRKVYEQLELLDQTINNARKAEGLDIPQSVEEDPESAGVDGLTG